MSLFSVLGLRPPARLQSAAAVRKTQSSDTSADASSSSAGKKGGLAKPAPKGELELGGASFDHLSIGPEISGPRLKTLWVLLAADGRGPIGSDEGWSLAETNRKAAQIQGLFSRMRDLQTHVYEDYGNVQSAAKQSVTDVAKLRKAAAAVGSHSKGNRGKDVREGVEGYVDGIDNVQDKLREITTRSKRLDAAVSAAHAAALHAESVKTRSEVADLKDALDAEKKRIEDMKKSLGELLDFAGKVVNVTEWAALATEATTYFGKQIIDAAIPTDKLDRLQKQLTEAKTKLSKLDSEEALALIQEKADELQAAASDLFDAQKDLAAAIDKLGHKQTTAIEALGSGSTADAARVIARKAAMLELIQRARQTIGKYHDACDPTVKQIDALAQTVGLYATTTPLKAGVDRKGPWAKSISDTLRENAEVLGVWSSYVKDIKASCDTMLRWIDNEGDGGPLEQFNQVRDILSGALKNR
jgi:hypothetical protein